MNHLKILLTTIRQATTTKPHSNSHFTPIKTATSLVTCCHRLTFGASTPWRAGASPRSPCISKGYAVSSANSNTTSAYGEAATECSLREAVDAQAVVLLRIWPAEKCWRPATRTNSYWTVAQRCYCSRQLCENYRCRSLVSVAPGQPRGWPGCV